MKIAVVMRQVPDLIEPIEIDASASAVDLDGAVFLANEPDDQALEQALLIKEKIGGGTVTVVALDFGEVDNTLYTAAAKGADQIIKIPYDQEQPPAPKEGAAAYAEVIRPLEPDLVLVGGYAHDELESALAPQLAVQMHMPYVGVVRGVDPLPDGTHVALCKEFPAAAMARLSVALPAVLGIVGADEPPRYVPVSRIRSVMKQANIREQEVAISAPSSAVTIDRLYLPESGGGAEMLAGSDDDVAAKIAAILRDKGIVA
jgi:electron transfer flavoprotein beta subunit